jgi:hypothetical protein
MGSYKLTVDTTVRNIVPFNPKRVVLIIVNNGDVTAYLSENQVNVVEGGLPLPPGASIQLLKVDGDDPRYAWYGQTASQSTELRIYEVFG